MKFRLLAIIGAMLVMFLMVGCAPGISTEEYNALREKLDVTVGELDEVKGELRTAQAKVEEYESKLAKVYAYAQVYDVDADPRRLALGLPTKHGYAGFGSPDYIANFKDKASATGDAELSEMVERGFGLPVGEEKTKAWSEVYVHLAEKLVTAAEP